jgi:CubicO group peptidase (beta-lactamase class C family)
MTSTPVQGTADERFAPLREVFQQHLDSADELGASLAVVERGRLVLDLWGGWADPARTTPWTADTLTNVWSISKTMTSLTALVLIDRGLLDPDEPVGTYWPEFTAAGKEGVLVRHVLQHTSGVSGWDQPVTGEDILDVPAATARLAAQAPWWPPGTLSGYHLLDYGHLVGELVLRVTGRTLGEYFRTEIAEPLGADFWLGLPESQDARVSHVVPPPPSQVDLSQLPPGSPARRTLGGPRLDADLTWTRAWKAAGIGGAGGHGNARSVARVQSALTGGAAGLLSPATVDLVFAQPTDNVDLVLGLPLRFGLGYAVSNPASTPHIPEGRVAFWGGWGGSIVVNDVDRGLTFAYVMNRMSPGILGSPRSDAYLQALYGSLDT